MIVCSRQCREGEDMVSVVFLDGKRRNVKEEKMNGGA